MITVRNINGWPESKPEIYFGSHSDENNFYFFESKQEQLDFYKPNEAQLLKNAVFEKKTEIQKKTDELMAAGFQFNNSVFGLSPDEKAKWLGIKNASADRFPIQLISKEGNSIQITAANVQDFYDAAFDRARWIEEQGGLLKYACNQCTTIEELQLINDNR